jgi:hypothetical protein
MLARERKKKLRGKRIGRQEFEPDDVELQRS